MKKRKSGWYLVRFIGNNEKIPAFYSDVKEQFLEKRKGVIVCNRV